MNAVTLAPFILVLSCGLARPQSAAPVDPGNKPNVFFGKEPKVDKSRQRDLKGVVKDEADNPMENAIVQLKDLKTGKTVSFVTKKEGTYLFYDLNMDIDYEVSARHDNFTDSAPKRLTKYDTRKPATLNFQLASKSTAPAPK